MANLPGDSLMLKSKLITALALIAVAGVAQAKSLPSSLTFDGFCDGITGLTSDGMSATGTHAFDACGGYTNEAMAGPAGKAMAGSSGKGAALSENSVAQFGYVLEYTVSTDGTWVGYSPDFGGIFNYGTWTKGYNGALKPGGKTSFQK
jgi:hypothetical protein